MKSTAALLLSALVLTAPLALHAADATIVRLPGVYDSGYQDGPRRLRAVFTAIGEGEWEVVFHFEHGGQRLAYSGTARGSLAEGELSGEVRSRNGRVFVFRGEVERGKFRGRHAEVLRGGREAETGTLQLG